MSGGRFCMLNFPKNNKGSFTTEATETSVVKRSWFVIAPSPSVAKERPQGERSE